MPREAPRFSGVFTRMEREFRVFVCLLLFWGTDCPDQTSQDYLNKIAVDNAPIRLLATPEELAHGFVFLCLPRSSYCVGSSYYVDGGWLNVVA